MCGWLGVAARTQTTEDLQGQARGRTGQGRGLCAECAAVDHEEADIALEVSISDRCARLEELLLARGLNSDDEQAHAAHPAGHLE